MRDKILLQIFRDYNRAFFDSKIEEPDVIEYQVMKNKAGYSEWNQQGSTKLIIHTGLKPFYRLTQVIMIHEMAHLALGPDYRPHHGTRWQAEINRLYMTGAYEGIL